MKQALLDTSFIMTCIKQKIDFFTYLEEEGFQILIPKQVIAELEGLAKSSTNAQFALKILLKKDLQPIDLKTRNVDEGIKEYAIKNNSVTIATLDKGIQTNVKNKKLIIRGKKKLEFT